MQERKHVLTIAMIFGLVLSVAVQPAAQGGPPPPPTNILFGFVTSNRTLTATTPGPIYYLPGDLIVNAGATLTIEPGVTLRFTANQDTLGGGDYPARCELTIRGTLIADATAGDSIRFLSTADGFGQWGQIKCDGGGVVTIRNAALHGPQVGIYSQGTATVENASISAASTGAVLRSAASVLRRSVIRDATHGIDAVAGGPTIQECALIGRVGSGVGIKLGAGAVTAVADSTDPRPTLVSRYATGVEMNSGAIADHIVAFKNTYGILTPNTTNSVAAIYCTAVGNTQSGIELSGTTLRVYMSISTNNGGWGIRHDSNPPCGGSGMDYIDSWSNAGGNYGTGSCAVGTRRDSFNPFYVNPAADDYRLLSGSVFKTYGPWGAEIGAYGPGPGSPTPVVSTSWGRVKATYR